MQTVKSGDTVKVHYHGKLANGATFDSSEGREPLAFKVGGGMVIKGFDNAMPGMKVGDKKTVNIPEQEGYGAHQKDLLINFPLEKFPADVKPEEGMELQMSNAEGKTFPVVVTEVSKDAVTLDANHPLAGKELVFEIELVEIA